MNMPLCPANIATRHISIKQRIALNFSRAAGSYDRASALQQRVAARVMQALPERLLTCDAMRIVDLGTGTGQHAQTLAQRYDGATVIGMDLAMGMLNFARANHPKVHWCLGDIESMPLQGNSVDLLYSSLAIQWCCFSQVLGEVTRVLKPGGTFAFATLAQGSLAELDHAWCAAGEHGRVNHFASFTTQRDIARSSALVDRQLSLTAETLYYPDTPTLLHSLRALGVNTILAGNSGLLTRQKLNALVGAYERLRQPQGLPLTYQIVCGVLHKPQ